MLRVLIVDDNPGFIAVLRELLKRYAQVLQVDSASNAADGQQAVAQRQPDLVFVDIKMPGTNGFELTTRLRQLHPQLRIILVSLSEDQQYHQHALEAGASGFVAKGRLFAELPQIVAQADAAAAAYSEAADSLHHLRATDLLGPSTEAALIVDASGFIVYANARLLALFGYQQTELIAQKVEMLVPQQLRETHREHRTSHHPHDRTHLMATQLSVDGRRKDGTTLPLLIRLNTLDHTESSLTVAFVSDLSDQAAQRSKLERLNRGFLMLHDCKLIAERAATERALLDGLCRRLAEFGPYPSVWVGLSSSADASVIELAASAGERRRKPAVASPTELDESIGVRSIRSNRPLVVRCNAQTVEAADAGVAALASLAIPFAVEAQRGCLCFDAATTVAFAAREIEWLRKVADDLAYGLTALRACACSNARANPAPIP